jgi:type II secretion system protein J
MMEVRESLFEIVAERSDASGMGFQPMNHRQDANAADSDSLLVTRQGACLPHWTREGAMYSLRFRLADSLPPEVLDAWELERKRIDANVRLQNRTLTEHEQMRLTQLHSQRVEKYLDAGHGECWLKDGRVAVIVRDALRHFDGQRYNIVAWCIMPNHVHVVVRPKGGYDLSGILHSWKSFTANRINQALARTGTVWQAESYDHLIRDEEDLQHAVAYVLDNPRVAGLDNWPWCGMGFQPMNHRQDADATSHGQDVRGTGPAANRGFTLAEVLVASTISGFIAIVAVSALSAVSHSAQAVNRASEVNAEIRFAARMLARDLANLYRDPSPENVRLIGASQGAETDGPPFLTFYTVGRAKARADQPEGDVYEVEYFLGTRQAQEGAAGGSSPDEPMVLFRRLWPNPDKERIPGGIVAPIAENIALFYVRFFDGQEWTGQWTEEMRTLPTLVEVTLATAPPERGDPVLETFTVSFPRMAETLTDPSRLGGSGQGTQESPSAASPTQGGPQGGDNTSQSQGRQGSQGSQGDQSRGRR